MKIAIITTGTPQDKKGAFNATHERIRHLKGQGIEVDVFIIRYYESRLMQLLRRKRYKKEARESFFTYDNIKYNNLWISLTLSDYFQRQKLNQLGSIFKKSAKKWSDLFAGYQLISAHSLEPGVIATLANEKFGIPFTVTWHGSDIHSMPQTNRAFKATVLKICRVASKVFFVSKQLQTVAANLGIDIANTEVLYNAVDTELFQPCSAEKKAQLKISNQITGDINVGFIGGLVAVKNCQALPGIFEKISGSFDNAKFYFIGDGKLRKMIAEKCEELKVQAIFMGNLPLEDMPGIINCFDLVVLPSLNEGMPLVLLECVASQTPIVASRVGGIPEILSDEYTVSLGDGFAEKFAEVAINLLSKPGSQIIELPTAFNWEQTSAKEAAIYERILNN